MLSMHASYACPAVFYLFFDKVNPSKISIFFPLFIWRLKCAFNPQRRKTKSLKYEIISVSDEINSLGLVQSFTVINKNIEKPEMSLI